MGDAAEFQMERDEHRAMYPFGVDVLFADEVREKNREILADYKWETRDGSKVKFSDMELSHLLNVVKMQERKGHKFAGQLRDYYQYRATVENRPDF